LISNQRYLYGGHLLFDGTHLIYLNDKLGRFVKCDQDGQKILEREAIDAFGALGRFNLEKNREYLRDPALMEHPEGVNTYRLFEDASLAGDRIYLLRVIENHPDWWTETKQIFVFDTHDFALRQVLEFPLRKGERVHAFTVAETPAGPRILVHMEVDDRIDLQIAELKP